MTRQEAIETAVRRALRLRFPGHYYATETPKVLHMANKTRPVVDYALCKSIRAHFRVVCRQYGVKAEPPAVFYHGYRIRVPDWPHGGLPPQ